MEEVDSSNSIPGFLQRQVMWFWYSVDMVYKEVMSAELRQYAPASLSVVSVHAPEASRLREEPSQMEREHALRWQVHPPCGLSACVRTLSSYVQIVGNSQGEVAYTVCLISNALQLWSRRDLVGSYYVGGKAGHEGIPGASSEMSDRL